MTEEAAQRVLYAALAAEVGLVVKVESTLRAKAVLYALRKRLGDPALDVLQVRLSPDDPDHELWLVKMGTEGA